MPSASLMTLNLSRSIGTRARRHAHTATNSCNTATHTCNTATHLESSSTTATQQPCCMHAPVHTSACTRPHSPKRLHTPGEKKKAPPPKKASDSPTSYHIYRRVDRTESQNTNRSLCLEKGDWWLWSFVTFRTVNRPTSVLRSRVIR